VIIEHLERTRDALVAATRGLTPEQWRQRTGETGWSVAEVVEHMALVDRGLLTVVTEKIPAGAAPAPGKASDAGRFARLAARIPPRTRRIEAPRQLIPSGTFASADAALAAFLEARGRLIAIAAAPPPEAAGRVAPHRFLGELDFEEWLYFAGLHCQRHVDQITEIRAAHGGPG
jgi:hypothetical protein